MRQAGARILNSTPGWESHGPEWGRHQPEVTQLEEGEPWPPGSVHQLVKLRSEPGLTGLPPTPSLSQPSDLRLAPLSHRGQRLWAGEHGGGLCCLPSLAAVLWHARHELPAGPAWPHHLVPGLGSSAHTGKWSPKEAGGMERPGVALFLRI